MIRKSILFGLVSLSLGMTTSCIDSESKIEDDICIIEPPYEPMFQFDEQEIPYRLNSPTLSPEMQRDLQKEVIGHGWKWMQTFVILEDGFVDPKDFYEMNEGKSSTSYYFRSDNKLVKFFDFDAINEHAYLEQDFLMDPITGIFSNNNKPTGMFPWSFFIRIWSIYQLKGRWYLSIIEPLRIKSGENGEHKIVWGDSQYYRMSDSELKQMLQVYNYDYSQIN